MIKRAGKETDGVEAWFGFFLMIKSLLGSYFPAKNESKEHIGLHTIKGKLGKLSVIWPVAYQLG